MSYENIVKKKNKNIANLFYFLTEKLFKLKTLLVKFWTGIVCNRDTYISI